MVDASGAGERMKELFHAFCGRSVVRVCRNYVGTYSNNEHQLIPNQRWLPASTNRLNPPDAGILALAQTLSDSG